MIRRFTISPDLAIQEEILLSEEESHHLARVLRLGLGTHLQLLDGRGNVHEAEIIAMGRRVRLRIHASSHVEEEGVPLRVCQGLLKGQKMEFLLQKCTELGVTEFVPFVSGRCQLKKSEHRKVSEKQGRWLRIIDEACKQCNRPRSMHLAPLLSFEEMVTMREEQDQGILFWEEEKEATLQSFARPAEGAWLQIVLGPEGGFSEKEAGEAEQEGFRLLSLGPRILRAETATLAAVSISQHLLGNM